MVAPRTFAYLCLLLTACRDETVQPQPAASPDMSAVSDLAAGPDQALNPGPKPLGGTLTNSGGSVDRLYFGFTGDTRPSNMDDTPGYPVATITKIFTRLADADVQFTLDLGDHMYVVNPPPVGDGGPPDEANVQMGLYMTAAQKLGARPLFMTLGNHDCQQGGNCFYNQTDPNFVAFMNALKPVSPLPYYTFTVATHSGPAVFIVLSDNYSGQEFSWFEQVLTQADATARYTIVMRHHPLGYASTTTMLTEQSLMKHKYSLFLTGHSHAYERDKNDPSGRTLIYGLGGVPDSGPGSGGLDWGYGTVQQGLDDRLYVTIYSQSTGLPLDSWNVGPQ